MTISRYTPGWYYTPVWYRLLNHLYCGLKWLFEFESKRPVFLLLWGTLAGLFCWAFWFVGETFLTSLAITMLFGWLLALVLFLPFLGLCLVIAVFNGLLGEIIGLIARRNHWQRRELRPEPVRLPPVPHADDAAVRTPACSRSGFWTGVLVGVGLAFLFGGS